MASAIAPARTDRHSRMTDQHGNTWRPLALHYGPGAATLYVRTDTEDAPATPVVDTAKALIASGYVLEVVPG
jgi:hypothetical protein